MRVRVRERERGVEEVKNKEKNVET